MYCIAILTDDISEERTLLRNRLESQFSRRNVHIDIFEYENGETFLTAAKECPFTVVFLDIYMNGSNGIDTAKELRRSDTDCLLIFTTTSTDHALEGFQVRALHYLVKPYSENDISVLADEILSRIPDSGKYIDVKVNGSNIQIPFRKIIYAEHFSHMIHIHTDGERELVTRQSFDSFITSLKMDSRFYQCNRGVVINLEHNDRQQRKQEPSGGNLQGTANCPSQNTDSQKKGKKPCCQLKRCLPQIVLYRQICQQYAGNDYEKFKYRAKYVSHFRTSFGTEIT